MKTTQKKENLKLAQELLQVREQLRELKKRESFLKGYFTALVEDDGCLKVGTAIIISKHQTERKSLDTKQLALDYDLSNYYNYKTYNTLKIQAV